MLQHDFRPGDKGAVYPFLGGGAARLADDGAEVALGEAEAVGVEADLMLLCGVVVDKLHEAVEDVAFVGVTCRTLPTGLFIEVLQWFITAMTRPAKVARL